MAQLDKGIQDAFWKLADMLATALAAGDKDHPPDTGWSVSGLASRAWKVNHPDLPFIHDDKGSKRDVLLQLHVDWNEPARKWFVLAQNLVNLPQAGNHGTLVVAQQDEPPGPTWDMQSIARDAARYFWDQKAQLSAAAQQMNPTAQPGQGASGGPPPAGGAGGGPPPPGGGGMPPDMGMGGGVAASRRLRVARLIVKMAAQNRRDFLKQTGGLALSGILGQFPGAQKLLQAAGSQASFVAQPLGKLLQVLGGLGGGYSTGHNGGAYWTVQLLKDGSGRLVPTLSLHYEGRHAEGSGMSEEHGENYAVSGGILKPFVSGQGFFDPEEQENPDDGYWRLDGVPLGEVSSALHGHVTEHMGISLEDGLHQHFPGNLLSRVSDPKHAVDRFNDYAKAHGERVLEFGSDGPKYVQGVRDPRKLKQYHDEMTSDMAFQKKQTEREWEKARQEKERLSRERVEKKPLRHFEPSTSYSETHGPVFWGDDEHADESRWASVARQILARVAEKNRGVDLDEEGDEARAGDPGRDELEHVGNLPMDLGGGGF